MRVLVTGGAGFIGSNLVHALLSGGHDVGVIDDLSTGKTENLHPRAWFRTLDILDAALPAVGRRVRARRGRASRRAGERRRRRCADPERDRAVNAEGTRAVARAARDGRARRASSRRRRRRSTASRPSDLPLRRDRAEGAGEPLRRLEARRPRALLAEELAGSGRRLRVSFRFSNVYGPRQDAAGEGGVVAIFCDAHARRRAPR